MGLCDICYEDHSVLEPCSFTVVSGLLQRDIAKELGIPQKIITESTPNMTADAESYWRRRFNTEES